MDRTTRHQVLVRVDGELDPTWSAVLAGLAVTAGPDGTTLISGELADQAAVHGLLGAIRDLGLSLVSIETAIVHRSPTPSGGSSCRS